MFSGGERSLGMRTGRQLELLSLGLAHGFARLRFQAEPAASHNKAGVELTAEGAGVEVAPDSDPVPFCALLKTDERLKSATIRK